MTATGIADPGPAARGLMTLGDGLMLHRLTDDPGLDMTRHRALGEKPDGQIVTGAVPFSRCRWSFRPSWLLTVQGD